MNSPNKQAQAHCQKTEMRKKSWKETLTPKLFDAEK